MMAIVGIPALLVVWVALRRSPGRAFIDVYLPVLLLLPDYYRWILPKTAPTFDEATIIPLMILYALQNFRQWRFSLLDLLVVGLAAEMSYSEYINTNYSDAQNLMLDCLANIVAPYILAKGQIESQGLRMDFARKFAGLLAIVSVTSVFEFRMGMNPYPMLLGRFFPGQMGWVTTMRYGFARIAGPYGHAILAGMILAVGYRVQRWVEWNEGWTGRLKWMPIEANRFVTWAIVGGIVMTLARGPWIGGMAGSIVILIGRAANRRRAAILVLVAILGFGIPAFKTFKSYVSVGRAGAHSESQETAAYRKELLDNYIEIAEERSAFGFGRNGWPHLPSMPSIDNYYLLITLMHGITALVLLLSISIYVLWRLALFGFSVPWSAPSGSLALSLMGAEIAVLVSLATVYLGMQTVPVTFILAGWAEGLVTNRNESVQLGDGPHPKIATETVPYEFKRVMA